VLSAYQILPLPATSNLSMVGGSARFGSRVMHPEHSLQLRTFLNHLAVICLGVAVLFPL
jgi:hypothetical protein